jgi:hypothetical protein
VSVIAAVLGALAFAAPAAAQTPILDAAEGSFRGRPVFFLATDLTPAEIQGLERQIDQEARGPLYIAILPAEARREVDGTTTGVALELNRRIVTMNPPAVHAVVIDDEFIAALAAIAVAVAIAALAGRKRGGTGRGG